MQKGRIGIIGCGDICKTYAAHFTSEFANDVTIAAFASRRLESAQAMATTFSPNRAMSVDDLLASPDIDLVLNLTPPAAHADITRRALLAGKHVYSEKPIALTYAEACKLQQLAQQQGRWLGCAPDTILGNGLQTCRALLYQGRIGTPIAAQGFMLCCGPESWHPNPEIFYQQGAGPLMDMGPYYLTALVHLLGPVKSVTSKSKISLPYRTITSTPRAGQTIEVEVPTYNVIMLEFATGPLATLTTSFDVWAAHTRPIEIFGTDGTLTLPDPNTFTGPISLYPSDKKQWQEMPLTAQSNGNDRGLAVATFFRNKGVLPADFPCHADMAIHVLEIMEAAGESARQGNTISLQCAFPAA